MSNRTILLVEDNPDDEALMLRALKKNNILNKVTVARDGAQAIEHLFNGPSADLPLPSVILLDLQLPKVHGLEVLRRIRADERTQAIPVVVLTSSRLQEDILKCYRDGANAFVRKPVSFSDFATAMNTFGMFWLHLNEVAAD
ncbi:MAG TPA: response regulator [Streptosporangiaceae bacterium]